MIDVLPTLAARVRLLSSSKTSKNDPNDALSTAIAGLRHCGLRRVERDDHTSILRLLADRHHDLTGLRTQAACRLHVMFRELSAGGAPLRISADQARQFLDNIEPGDLVDIERRESPLSISPTLNASTGRSTPSSNASLTPSPHRARLSPSCTVSAR